MRPNGGKAGSAKLRAIRREQRLAIEHALDLWFEWPQSFEDLCHMMEWHLRFVRGQRSPVVTTPVYGENTPTEVFDRNAALAPDTIAVLEPLIVCNAHGFMTVNSQDGQFAAGHGHAGPYEERQRAYVSGFVRADTLRMLRNPPAGITVTAAPAGDRAPRGRTKRDDRIIVTEARKPGGRWRRFTASPELPTGEARDWCEHIPKAACDDLLTTMEVCVLDTVWERKGLFPWVARALTRGR